MLNKEILNKEVNLIHWSSYVKEPGIVKVDIEHILKTFNIEVMEGNWLEIYTEEGIHGEKFNEENICDTLNELLTCCGQVTHCTGLKNEYEVEEIRE